MNSNENKVEPSQQDIAVCAYHLWESNGRQEGRDAEYWFQALAQLKSRAKTPTLGQSTTLNQSNQPQQKNGSGSQPKKKADNAPRREPAFA